MAYTHLFLLFLSLVLFLVALSAIGTCCSNEGAVWLRHKAKVASGKAGSHILELCFCKLKLKGVSDGK